MAKHETRLNNADVLRLVTVNPATVEAFRQYVMRAANTKGAHWWPKAAGEQPTDEMLTACTLFGKNRKVGPEAGFVAMQWRAGGASLAELAAAFNSGPAHNHTRNDIAHNLQGVGPWYCERTTGGGRFTLTFTSKGQKQLEKLLATAMPQGDAGVATDKPKAKKAGKVAANSKATSKPRKGKVKVGDLTPADVAALQAVSDAADAEHAQSTVDPERPAADPASNDGAGTDQQQNA